MPRSLLMTQMECGGLGDGQQETEQEGPAGTGGEVLQCHARELGLYSLGRGFSS